VESQLEVRERERENNEQTRYDSNIQDTMDQNEPATLERMINKKINKMS